MRTIESRSSYRTEEIDLEDVKDVSPARLMTAASASAAPSPSKSGKSWSERNARATRRAFREILTALPPEAQQQVWRRMLQRMGIRAKESPWRDTIEPASFDVFCSKYLKVDLYPEQRRVFAESGTLRAGDIIDPLRLKQILVVVFGKGAGKDMMIACFVAYAAWVLLQMKDVHGWYNVSRDTKISIINVAPTIEQAYEIFFDYLKKQIQKPVFSPYIIDPKQIGSKTIRFPQINLTLRAKTPKSLEGYNPLIYIIDEGDDFLDNQTKSVADHAFKALRTSARTRFGDRSIGFLISYPRTEDGFMMREYHWAANDEIYYRIKRTTFEVRPDRSMEEKGIASDFRRDARDARAKYLCIPQSVLDAFFEHPHFIEAAIDPTRRPCARVVHDPPRVVTKRDKTTEYVTLHVEDIVREPGRIYFLAGDAGKSKDAYTLAVMYLETGDQDAYAWLCNSCGADTSIRMGARYAHYTGKVRGAPEVDAEPPICGICGRDARDLGTHIQAWWRHVPKSGDGDAGSGTILINGKEWRIPHVHEALVVEFRPEPGKGPDDQGRVVDMLAVQKVCEDLIHALGIEVAGFDPHMTEQLSQQLMVSTGCSVRALSQANPEQLRRGKMVRMLVYNGRMTLLDGHVAGMATDPDGGVVRDREWRRLQILHGAKLDHPKDGSKDVWDSEAMATWLAVTYNNAEIELGFM